MATKKVSGRKSRISKKRAPTPQDEARAWARASAIAAASYKFWKGFLVLRRGPNGTDPLTAADDKEFMYAIRAASWAESLHGTGAGVTASRDPMQCGNPRDAWWPQIAGIAAQFDRFVRGGAGSTNYDSNQLPGVVVTLAGWNTAASTGNLTDVKLGHGTANNDNGFDAEISYWWAVPHLIWKINVGANGHPAFKCGNVVRSELIAGCIKYNGGGDAGYPKKIQDAYDLFAPAAVPALPAFAAPCEGGAMTGSDLDQRLRVLLESVVATLATVDISKRAAERLFFPDGIRLIDLSVQIAEVKVTVKVSGSAGARDGSVQPD